MLTCTQQNADSSRVSTALPPVPRRARTGAVVAPALVALAALVAAVGLAAPGAQSGWEMGYVAQALAQAAAAVACLRVARAAAGQERLAWGLLCAGQALLAATNLAFAVADSLVAVPEVSAFDALWLAYYLPMLGAVAVFYRRRRPEPDWIGVIDALILTGALTLIVWEWGITPLAESGAGGLEGAAINTLYPTLDLFGFAVIGWLAMRQGGRPRWLVWVAASFLAAVVADAIYLRGALVEAPSAIGVSAGVYILAATCLVLAADRRRVTGAAGLSGGRAVRPRPWVQVLPFVLVVPLLVIVSDDHHDPVVDTIADVIIAIVIARLSWSVIRLDSVGRENQRLLVTDPLTGAFNRRFLAEEIVRLAARARRDGGPLAVVMLDLDRFKQVNDTLGHGLGDAFLRSLVAQMRTRLRAGDVLCRMGGDEFVLLLPGTDEEGALQLTERLQDAVAAARAQTCPEIPVGGSFGAAAQEGAGVDAAGLLKRADVAMYAAKRAGGARTMPLAPGDGGPRWGWARTRSRGRAAAPRAGLAWTVDVPRPEGKDDHAQAGPRRPRGGPDWLRRDELRRLLRAGGGRRGDPDHPPRARPRDHAHRHGRGRTATAATRRWWAGRSPGAATRWCSPPSRAAAPPTTCATRSRRACAGWAWTHVDVYYLHRVDAEVPIEESVGAMARAGGDGAWCATSGCPRPGPQTIRRAHAVHPIAALQSEYSLLQREPEREVLPVLRELGIAYVAYSPLSRGLLTGRIRTPDDLAPDDWRRQVPRFQGDNLARNLTVVAGLAEIAGGPRRRPRDPRPRLAPRAGRRHRPAGGHQPGRPRRGQPGRARPGPVARRPGRHRRDRAGRGAPRATATPTPTCRAWASDATPRRPPTFTRPGASAPRAAPGRCPRAPSAGGPGPSPRTAAPPARATARSCGTPRRGRPGSGGPPRRARARRPGRCRS